MNATATATTFNGGGRLNVANLRAVAGVSAVVVTLAQTATAVVALRSGRRDYADAVWGPGLAAVSVVGALVGRGDAWRRWSLAVVSTGWAVRLERQMLTRVRGSDEEDPRYTEFLQGASTPKIVANVFLTQGLSQLLVSAPVQLAAASTLPRSPRRWLAPVGVAVMVAGAVVEALADKQKQQYMQRGDEKPEVLDTGLWGFTRHPNYFGDSLVWDGAYVAAAASSPAGWALPAPALMSYLLMFATGAKRTERRMKDRPGYSDYQQRVAFFFPRPPRDGGLSR